MILESSILTGEKIQELADCYIGKQSDFEFNPRIFSQSTKFVYLDSLHSSWNNPPIIFCYSNHIEEFSKKINNIMNKCILILGNSDENITLDKCTPLLNYINIVHIFTQNMMCIHPKISFIPIGIANSQWLHGNLSVFSNNQLESFIKSKNNSIFCSFNINTNKDVRKKCMDTMVKFGIQNYTFASQLDYINILAMHNYCICPRGNGVDTHRFWEAQLLKVVPIVDKNIFTEYLYAQGYPCILVDNWDTFDIYSIPSYDTFTWKSCDFSIWKNQILNIYTAHILEPSHTTTKPTINVVLSFIGKMPDYILLCISQLRLFYKGPIYIIYSDITELQKQSLLEKTVTLIEYSQVRSERFDYISQFKSFCVVDRLNDRKELFKKSYERLYLLEKLMDDYSLRNVWFMEIDVMMYVDPTLFLETLLETPYTYCYHDKDHCNTSIIFIRDSQGLNEILNTLDNFTGPFISEMVAMRHHLATHPTDTHFPLVYPCDVNEYYYKDINKYNGYIFDGAVMGQYLFGVDSIHTGNVILQKNTENIKHLLNVWSYGKFIWKETADKLYIPYYISNADGKEYPVANLHIHSKDLLSASSLLSKMT